MNLARTLFFRYNNWVFHQQLVNRGKIDDSSVSFLVLCSVLFFFFGLGGISLDVSLFNVLTTLDGISEFHSFQFSVCHSHLSLSLHLCTR